jgi:hypothetical protein
VEVLVSLALLAILGTVMGVVFSVGMRAILAPGASQDRLEAASNTITLEQFLSEDVDRATCVYVPPGWYGGCSKIQANGDCANADLCLGWPDLAVPGQCDVAVYHFSTSPSEATRTEWLGQEQGTTTTVSEIHVAVTPPPPGWPMPVDLTLRATGSQLANPPTVPLQLEPLANQTWPTGNNGLSDSPC